MHTPRSYKALANVIFILKLDNLFKNSFRNFKWNFDSLFIVCALHCSKLERWTFSKISLA